MFGIFKKAWNTVKAGGIKAAAVVVGGAVAATTFVGTGAVVVYKYVERKAESIIGEGAKGNLFLVNGTDKDWVIAKKHSYQMNKWDNSFPQTIKSGEMQTVNIEFAQRIDKILTDSGGEVSYQIAGTDQTFEIQARVKGNEAEARVMDKFSLQVVFTNLNTRETPKGATIPLGWDDKGSRYFILAGKDGKYTGNGMDTANWMQNNMKDFLGDRRLMEICMPGSHDSGMSRATWTVDGSAESTILTHTKRIAQQLELGARFLDIRPITLNGAYYTAHMQKKDVMGLVKVVGGTGQPIDEVINEVNAFTNNHNELVILNLSHAITVKTNDLNTTPPDFNQADWEKFLNYLNSGLKNLIVAPANADLSRMKLNDLLKDNKKVIVLLADKTYSEYNKELDKDINIPITMPTSLHGKGFFTTTDNFTIYDKYADKKDWDKMAEDQYEKLNNLGFQYFLMSWTLTQQWDDGGDKAKNIIGTSKTIIQLAQEANWSLPEIYPRVTSIAFPNIIYIDDIRDDQSAALAMAINWKRSLFAGNYGPKPLAVLYTDPNFAGAMEGFHEVGKLLPIEQYVKNDTASSIKVPSGYKVTLYEKIDGTGEQLVIDGDREYDVKGFKGLKDLTKTEKSKAFNDIASSLKIEKQDPPAVTIYKDGNFSAESDIFYQPDKILLFDYNVKNDNASSLEVLSGYIVTLYENPDGTGKQFVIDGDREYDVKGFPGRANLVKTDFNDIASSLKIEKKNNPAPTPNNASTQTAEHKAFANTLIGTWTDGNEIPTFTENGYEAKMVNADKPYAISTYKVIDANNIEINTNGRIWTAKISFEDNGNTLVWHGSGGQSSKYKRVNPK